MRNMMMPINIVQQYSVKARKEQLNLLITVRDSEVI